MNTKSDPESLVFISFSDSLAACSPIFGLEPAPSPDVSSRPIRIFVSTFV